MYITLELLSLNFYQSSFQISKVKYIDHIQRNTYKRTQNSIVMAGTFQLNSTQTAIAIIPPEGLTSGIQKLRSKFDKAYAKWPPHFNILYPSIPATQLSAAVQQIRDQLAREPLPKAPLNLSIEEVGSFRHRKNATVFLKLAAQSEERVNSLRNYLCRALERDASEGTVDGEFKPHLTIGQAVLQGKALQKLTETAGECLNGLRWECGEIAVLKRNSSGNMDVVDSISLGTSSRQNHPATAAEERFVESSKATASLSGWDSCIQFDGSSEVAVSSESKQSKQTQPDILVASFNIMAEDWAPAFDKRFPLIEAEIDTLLSAHPNAQKVLCLQEVNQDMLSHILQSSKIQKHLPFRSHSSSSHLPSIRNKITLASLPFKHFALQFPEKHKSALLANFEQLGKTVVNVHLTSALTDDAVQKKKRQMDILTDFLMQKKVLKTAILAGDFNLTTSMSTVKTALEKKLIKRETVEMLRSVIHAGRWSDAFIEYDSEEESDDEAMIPGEEGATFDRINNELAGASVAPIDNRPQRYDRILIYKGMDVTIEEFGLFAKPKAGQDVQMSDHYGIYTVLQSADIEVDACGTQDSKETGIEVEDINIVQDDFDVKHLLAPLMPTEDDRSKREVALALLKETFTKAKTLNGVIVAPLGSYAMDTYFADSDIDVLVIGSVSQSTFFDAATKLLSKQAGSENEAPHAILINSLVRVLETTINGIKVDIQYCQAHEVVAAKAANPSTTLETLVFDDELTSTLKPNSLRPLNTLRDTLYLQRTMPDKSTFCITHRFLSLFLRRQGLYSARFGYLGGIHLTLLLNRVMKLMKAKSDASFTPSTTIRTFFQYYAKFDWAHEAVEDPIFHPQMSKSFSKRVGLREPVIIRALHLPTARSNVAASCTRLTAKTIATMFRTAATKLASSAASKSESAWKWLIRSSEASVSDFLNLNLELTNKVNDPGCFVRVRIEAWDLEKLAKEGVRDFIGGVESMMPHLLAALNKAGAANSGEEINGRVWPARFWVPSSQEKEHDEKGLSLSGYYLFGITSHPIDDTGSYSNSDDDGFGKTAHNDDEEDDWGKPHNGKMSSTLQSKVISAAREFERMTGSLGVAKWKSVYVEVDVVEKKKIWEMGLSVDTRNWTSYASTLSFQLFSKPAQSNSGEATQVHSSLLNRNTSKKTATGVVTTKKPLRPIQDVLSRIHWDSDYDAEEYLIGYEDRFDGVKEIALTSWNREATDEEFIPLHRIVWVRKRGSAVTQREDEDEDEEELGEDDGEKVWDRRVRYDAIFGSGVRHE
jgi:uncharacterized protein (UPF0248 family)/2'-5' RNA ligase/endonuclease/exonuclease/phosphatase family metal-dependent hydrolase